MRDHWKNKKGERWQSAEHTRIGRIFRHHVRVPSNPRGRIHREPCHWHASEPGEAHHTDYTKPWCVVWAGAACGCHRKIDHGSLKVPLRAIWDYSSLIEVRGVAKVGARKEKRGAHKREVVPF